MRKILVVGAFVAAVFVAGGASMPHRICTPAGWAGIQLGHQFVPLPRPPLCIGSLPDMQHQAVGYVKGQPAPQPVPAPSPVVVKGGIGPIVVPVR